jgi:hypothetical protein
VEDLQITSKKAEIISAVDELDTILSSSIFKYASVEDCKEKSMQMILEEEFEFLQELRKRVFRPPIPIDCAYKKSLTKTIFVWKIIGNLTNFKKLSDHIGKVHTDAIPKTVLPDEKIIDNSQSQEPIKGFITIFQPQIWIGDLPTRTFRQRALTPSLFPSIVHNQNYKNRVVAITQNGIIAIGEKNNRKAVRFLNEIMAVLLLSGIETSAITENDLGEAEFTAAIFRSWEMVGRLEKANCLEYPEFKTPLIKLKEEKIINLIEKAANISTDCTLSDYLVFLLQAYTHKQNSEFTQSFILSWLIIERQISWQWVNFLSEEGVAKRRRDKLMNSNYWTIDFVIEALSLSGNLPSNEYDILISLKNKRNDIIHSGETPSKEETNKCYLLACQIVKERCGMGT